MERMEQRNLLTTITVLSLNDGPGSYNPQQETDTTLRGALTHVHASGDTIVFGSSLNGSIHLNSPLNIGNSLSIDGAKHITIDGGSKVQDFEIAGNASVTLKGLTITHGQAALGGGILNNGTVTISDCIVSNNNALERGGALFNRGTATISGSTFSSNKANVSGGAIVSDKAITISSSTFTLNQAKYGGAIISLGTATIDGSTLANNKADDGGAVDNLGTMSINASTLSANSAHVGGAINNSGRTTITSSTLAGNTANHSGGAISCDGSATLSISSSTISGNTASYGGGIRLFASPAIFLANTIVAGNIATSRGSLPAGPDIDGQVQSTSHNNLIGSGVGMSGIKNKDANHNQVGGVGGVPVIDPKLSALANHGGPTQTMVPMAGSPAINGGDPKTPNLPQLDQRGTGFPRIINGRLDIGAVETP